MQRWWSGTTILLGLLVWADAPVASTLVDSTVLEYAGLAKDRDSGQSLYREKHWLLLQDDKALERIVLYTCVDGRPVARKVVDYSAGALAPNFALENALASYQEGLRSNASQRTVHYRTRSDRTEHAKSFKPPAGLVADAGFDEFVRRHWNELLRGDRVRFHFLVPSRLENYSFKLRWIQSQTIEGQPVEVFRLGLTGLLGMIAPDIDVHYRREDRVLMRYEGVTNIRDPKGENYDARIEFPTAQRKITSNRAGMEAARSAKLVTSCS